MASAEFWFHKEWDEEGVRAFRHDDIEDLSMAAPYWMLKLKSGVREFIHFDTVRKVRIEGEEELVQAAKARKDAELAQNLGLEA